MIGHSELLANRAAVPPLRSVQEGSAAASVGGSQGTVDADLIKSRDLISLVRALPERFGVLLAELPGDRLDGGRGCERPAPGTLSSVERVIGVGDLVRATADHLERVAGDARPVHARCYLSEPIAGYHRWAWEHVLSLLATESERLAGAAERLSVDESLPAEVRLGMSLIIIGVLRHLLAESAEQLDRAERLRR